MLWKLEAVTTASWKFFCGVWIAALNSREYTATNFFSIGTIPIFGVNNSSSKTLEKNSVKKKALNFWVDTVAATEKRSVADPKFAASTSTFLPLQTCQQNSKELSL